MDPLSVAGSIAGLISLSDVVFRKLYHYVKDVQHAEKEVQDLKDEVAALNGVLHNLHLVAQDLETSSLQNRSIRPEHVNSCLATLYQLDDKINKAGIFDKGKLRAAIHKLSWPFKAVNTKKFIDDIRSHRDRLTFALSADSMAALLRCLSKQDELLSSVAGLESRLQDRQENETKIALNAERQKLLDQFSSFNPEISFRKNMQIRHATSGFWLTETDKFVNWMRGSNLHLWLSGIPGAGKTILSSLIIQQCMKQATKDRVVAFFYCDYKNSKSQDLVQILSSLASQLARKHEECFQLLENHSRGSGPQPQSQHIPQIEGLVALLQDMSNVFEDVRLIVDGLDECNENAGEVAKTFKSLVDDHATISLCLLSRDEHDIRAELDSIMFDHIEIAAHTEDIEHYVRTEIEDRRKRNKLRLKSDALKDEIVDQLVSRANGMFRWVACQLDHLCELPTDALRRKALHLLPSTLHETYARLLTRIKEPARPLVRRALQWIAYAEPKLLLEELVEIVSIDENDVAFDREACPDPEDLLRYCGSLVRNDDGQRELAHFTVQEFLEAIKPDDPQLNGFQLRTTDTLILAKTCVNYLCLPPFNQPPSTVRTDAFEDHLFYDYGCSNLPEYVSKLRDEDEIHECLKKLFRPQKTHNLTNFVLQYMSRLSGTIEQESIEGFCSHQFDSIHAATMFHFAPVCQWLIQQGCDVNQTSAFGVPLECAIYGTDYALAEWDDEPRMEHLFHIYAQQTITVLLEFGAMCDVDVVHSASLGYAIATGPFEALTEMLRHGLTLRADALDSLKGFNAEVTDEFLRAIDDAENANIPPDVKLQLLNLARSRKITISAKLPCDEGMNDDVFLEAVVYSAKYGPISALQSLATDVRFVIDMRESSQSATLLHMAAQSNFQEGVEFLLGKGFDPVQLDQLGWTVLHHAVHSGVKEVGLLRRLLQKEIADVADNHGRNVWHIAAERGRLYVLDLLNSYYDTDHTGLNAQDRSGKTPLLEAIINRHDECASYILRSLSPGTTFETDSRILFWTVATGLESLLREFVDMGANLQAESEHSRNALYYITEVTTLEMVETLLSHGLDVDRLDDCGRSPLADFLEHEQRLRRLSPIRSESAQLDLSIVSKLATTKSVTTPDTTGNHAWMYFCTKTAPRLTCREVSSTGLDDLVGLFSLLVQQDALIAYEESTSRSGIGLLIEMCLGATHGLKSTNPAAMSLPIGDFFSHVFRHTTGSYLIPTHPQAVRLLIWSIRNSDRGLLMKLLQLGVDVHAESRFYNGNAAIDLAIEENLEQGFFDLVLAHAQPHRIPKSHPRFLLRHFCLCQPPSPVKEKHTTQESASAITSKPMSAVSKLEAILKKGVDPNARSDQHVTAAHLAAGHGFLEGIEILVAHHANLLLRDKAGRTAIHHAIDAGQVEILRYLRQLIVQDEEWTRRVVFTPVHTMQIAGQLPQSRIVGPLAVNSYFQCSLTHVAAYKVDSASLQFLQDNNVLGDIDSRSQEGATPLHFAVCCWSTSTTRWLLENGADVNAKCGTRDISALHVALRWGHLENAIALIEAGATFSADSAGITPEMQMHPSIRADLLNTLPHVGVPIPTAVMEAIRRDHQRASFGSLYKAIIDGDLKSCSSIIAGTPDWDSPLDECGSCTPLIVALSHGRLEIARLFLSHGASTNGRPCSRSPELYHIRARSVIEIAIQRPVFNGILEEILEASLSYEAHWSQALDCWRPLHLAAAMNVAGIKIFVNHIIKHFALLRCINHSAAKRFETSPSEFLKAGLENQSAYAGDKQIKGFSSGGTSLHIATIGGKLDAVAVLLKLGVDPNVRDRTGATSLHYAVSMKETTITEKLLEAGARLNVVTMGHGTPLMTAALAGAMQVIPMLMGGEGDSIAVDHQGQTAFHYAAQQPSLDVFAFFLNAGWDPYQIDDGKRSPVHYALSRRRLNSYIYAHCLDLTQVICAARFSSLGLGFRGFRLFLCYLTKATKRSYLAMETVKGNTVLTQAANAGPDFIRVCIKAGANLEMTRKNGDTALIAACRAGKLLSVACLVRNGAKPEYEHQGRMFNAYIAANGHPEVVQWLLVERWTEQGKLGSEPANSGEQVQYQSWTGVRTVMIPLRGNFERPKGSSLFDYAKYLHEVSKRRWRILVPLGWDTVANLVPLPGEA